MPVTPSAGDTEVRHPTLLITLLTRLTAGLDTVTNHLGVLVPRPNVQRELSGEATAVTDISMEVGLRVLLGCVRWVTARLVASRRHVEQVLLVGATESAPVVNKLPTLKND